LKSPLVCGFYLNELMLKLLVRDDPHPALFQQYVSTLNQLAHGEPVALVLRQFELVLLKEAGLLGDLRYCSGSRMRVVPELAYVLDPEAGVRPAQHQEQLPVVSGACLLAMQAGDFREQQIQIQSKTLNTFIATASFAWCCAEYPSVANRFTEFMMIQNVAFLPRLAVRLSAFVPEAQQQTLHS
jgi:DNA repair protein RecO (recombination protein O)